MPNTTPVVCECDSFGCDKNIQLPIEVAQQILQSGYFVIVDGCPFGPSDGDELVEKREGYSLYRET